MRVERVEEPTVFGFTWPIYGLPEHDPRRTHVEFTLEPDGAGTRLTAVESGFAQLPEDAHSMHVAQQFLAALAATGTARSPRCRTISTGLLAGPSTIRPHETGGHHGRINDDTANRYRAGMGGSAPAAAGEGEGADPGSGRAGRAAPADAVAGGGERL
jgi:hypothetical protein